MRIKLHGFDAAVQALRAVERELPQVASEELGAEAARLAKYMQDRLGAVPYGLKPNTILTGGKDPLRRTLELQQTITSEKVRSLLWFIGVPKRANRYRVATVHEFGTTITMKITPKQAAWMRYNLPPPTGKSGSKSGYLVVVIPARPYVRPTFDYAQQELGTRLAERFSAFLERKFSGV